MCLAWRRFAISDKVKKVFLRLYSYRAELCFDNSYTDRDSDGDFKYCNSFNRICPVLFCDFSQENLSEYLDFFFAQLADRIFRDERDGENVA